MDADATWSGTSSSINWQWRRPNNYWEWGGQEPWHVQWIRSGLPLSQAKHYRLTFRASAASAHTLHAYMGRNGHPWTPYNNYPAFTITNEPRDYFFDLFMKDIADPDAHIGFDLGRSTTQVVFYEIRLEEVL